MKNTANFPFYDLPANSFPRKQISIYYPIPDINAYSALLESNGLTLAYSIDTTIQYIHYPNSLSLPDVGVIMLEMSDGSYDAEILYRSNQNLVNAVTPAGVPLVGYVLTDFYVGERNFVIDHIAQYKNALIGLGFREAEDDGITLMKKEVGNCVYRWFYQYYDHYLGVANNGAIDYNWEIVDKAYVTLIPAMDQEN